MQAPLVLIAGASNFLIGEASTCFPGQKNDWMGFGSDRCGGAGSRCSGSCIQFHIVGCDALQVFLHTG